MHDDFAPPTLRFGSQQCMILEVSTARLSMGNRSAIAPCSLFPLMHLEVLLARVTIEDCSARIGNQFALVILAALRAHQPIAEALILDLATTLLAIAARSKVTPVISLPPAPKPSA